MKKLFGNNNIPVSAKDLHNFFDSRAKIEQEKNDRQKKLLEEKIKTATKGGNIVVSNYSK